MNRALLLTLTVAMAATGVLAQEGGAAGGGAAGGGAVGGGAAGGAATTGGTTGGGNTGGGAGGGTTGGGTSRIPGNTGQQNPANQQSPTLDFPRPIFLSGKVMMDNGTPVPSNVVIQRLCNGTPQSVAYTDTKGHFSFQWGQSNGMMIDASQSGGGFGGFPNRSSSSGMGGMGSMGGMSDGPSMAGCELRAELAGYRSDMVNLFNRQQMDNPDVGVIVLHRMGNVEGVSISATSLNAPKDARKAFDKGLQLMLKNKSEDAMKEFDKAATIYPKFADAWVNIGKLRIAQKNVDGGREAFLKAIEADAKLVAPHIELGMMAARENKWEEAAPYLDRGLKLDPIDFPLAWYASAAANFNLKKYDVAEKSAREAIKMDPRHRNPRAEYILGLILAEKHEYSGAADQLKTYLKFAPNAPDLDTVKDQLGQLEKFLKETEASKQP